MKIFHQDTNDPSKKFNLTRVQQENETPKKQNQQNINKFQAEPTCKTQNPPRIKSHHTLKTLVSPPKNTKTPQTKPDSKTTSYINKPQI